MNTTKSKLTLTLIAASLALAGCGGGGGGGSTGPSSTAPTTPTTPTVPTTPTTPDPNALQPTVGGASYVSGSIELSAFTTLNEARSAYGVGQLAQATSLDAAAGHHADYIGQRFKEGDYSAATHDEDASKSGYTGGTPDGRISYAGYAASATGENLSSIIAVDGVSSDAGAVAVTVLLSGPYHRFGLFDGYRDVGIGHNSQRLPNEGGMRNTVVVDSGVARALQPQQPATDWVGMWPLNGATNVLYSFAGETPNPIPVNKGACAGYPVSVQVRDGQTLATSAFTLTETASGAAVNVQLSTKNSDANPSQARANTAYIIPYKPLKLATQYTAHFVGSRNGVAIDKTWTFTTRADNVKLVYGCDPS